MDNDYPTVEQATAAPGELRNAVIRVDVIEALRRLDEIAALLDSLREEWTRG